MLNTETALDSDDLSKLFAELPIASRLSLIEDGTLLELLPHDVGAGVSQLLPVVVASLAPGASLVCIEQPELHIHPGLQVRLGDLFASQISGEDPKRFIIETHSEHLLLRLLRRVRETVAGDLPPGAPPLHPADLSVLYFESGPDGTEVRSLKVTEDGDFESDWPAGFFQERAEELF
jgi:predicted ATPase